MGVREFLEAWGGGGNPYQKRRENVMQFMEKMANMGINDPDIINAAAEDFIRTGVPKLPTQRKIAMPTEGPADIFGKPPAPYVGTEPLRLGARRAVWDEDKSQYREAPELQGISQFLNPPEKRTDGEDIYIDAKTGAEIGRVPNRSGRNKTIKVGSVSEPGSKQAEDPEAKAQREVAKKTLEDYYNTEDPDEAQTQTAARAAEFLGFPVEEVTEKAGTLAKWFGAQDKTVKTPTFGKKTPGPGTAKVREFKSEEEVNNARLPEGTIVKVNGRRFRVSYQ